MSDVSENKQRMQRGELYHAFTPELVAERSRCTRAVNMFNNSQETSRRHRVELWRKIILDHRPMPEEIEEEDADTAQFELTDPWIEPPVRIDYGTQVFVQPGAFVNFNSTFIDTLPIRIGARTLVGPNCSFYSGTHPIDPAIRHGTLGPEGGGPITIGEDCWLGGNVIVLPGISIGNGSTIGAGSVVTKDVEPYCVVAGNPARLLKRLEPSNEASKGIETPNNT